MRQAGLAFIHLLLLMGQMGLGLRLAQLQHVAVLLAVTPRACGTYVGTSAHCSFYISDTSNLNWYTIVSIFYMILPYLDQSFL